MSYVLIQDDASMLVSPRLALAIGLNEAIVLQQVHYWLMKTQREIDGRRWVYNTYKNWNKQFPFWSVSMVKRVFKSLENKGLLLTGTFNKSRMDQTKWYTIDYDKLERMTLLPLDDMMTNENIASYEIEKKQNHDEKETLQRMDGQELLNCLSVADEEVVWSKAIPETTQETTTKITTECKDKVRLAEIEGCQMEVEDAHCDVLVDQLLWSAEDEKNEQSEKETNEQKDASSELGLEAEEKAVSDSKIPYGQVIAYLNEKTGSQYRATSGKTRRGIRARYNEGFKLEDFKRVIDLKTEEWKDDPYWCRFLRPETLFGSKFESYLNQKPAKRMVKKVLREEDFDLHD